MMIQKFEAELNKKIRKETKISLPNIPKNNNKNLKNKKFFKVLMKSIKEF